MIRSILLFLGFVLISKQQKAIFGTLYAIEENTDYIADYHIEDEDEFQKIKSKFESEPIQELFL